MQKNQESLERYQRSKSGQGINSIKSSPKVADLVEQITGEFRFCKLNQEFKNKADNY